MDPYCPECETFHQPDRCAEIQARRATVTPINVKQLSLSDDVDDPMQLCRSCDARVPLSELSEAGQCDVCATTLEELLAESLRRRGIEVRS